MCFPLLRWWKAFPWGQMEKKCVQKNKRPKWAIVAVILLLLIGLSIMLYPVGSNLLNSMKQADTIAQYMEAVDQLSEEDYAAMLAEAEAYNQALVGMTNRYYLTKAEKAIYGSLLNVTGTGVMGYLEIPSLGETMPIYHGTDESVLQVAIGHVAGSSLPIGGASTHCILSGHRGLPEARLFTDLDKLKEGDVFHITVLGRTITYEVDQILVTEPADKSPMEIFEGQDYCTLMTCTPYGINTHRLLVRGTRVE